MRRKSRMSFVVKDTSPMLKILLVRDIRIANVKSAYVLQLKTLHCYLGMYNMIFLSLQ